MHASCYLLRPKVKTFLMLILFLLAHKGYKSALPTLFHFARVWAAPQPHVGFFFKKQILEIKFLDCEITGWRQQEEGHIQRVKLVLNITTLCI